jgi:hypothetical protein
MVAAIGPMAEPRSGGIGASSSGAKSKDQFGSARGAAPREWLVAAAVASGGYHCGGTYSALPDGAAAAAFVVIGGLSVLLTELLSEKTSR